MEQIQRAKSGIKLEDIQIVTISLDRRPDRWAKFMDNATAAGLQGKVQKISAVDAKEFVAHMHPSVSLLTAHNIKNNVRRSHYEIDRPGAVGASLSHFKAWNYLLNSAAPAIIVFEDDAVIPLDVKARLNKMLNDLPPEWDMITFTNTTFAGGERACVPIPEQSPWQSCLSLMGAHAYMLSRRGAQRLLKQAYPIELHVDAYMAFMARMGHIEMLWYPVVEINQPFDDSDINHSSYGILDIPTNLEQSNYIAMELPTLLGAMSMAAVVGGLLALAYVVKKH